MPHHTPPSGTSSEPADARSDALADHWPVHFPHAELDELLERVANLGADSDEVGRSLLLIGREAQRLRSTVMRLSAARLSAADEQANRIVRNAQEQAQTLCTGALQALESRLAEADSISAAVREVIRVERRALDRPGSSPRLRAVENESGEPT